MTHFMRAPESEYDRRRREEKELEHQFRVEADERRRLHAEQTGEINERLTAAATERQRVLDAQRRAREVEDEEAEALVEKLAREARIRQRAEQLLAEREISR